MRLPIKWLCEYVDVSDIPPKKLCHDLTMSGSKVEALDYIGEGIDRVVVGKVLSTTCHPNSDHLWICQVDVAGPRPLQIVTGAQNVTAGALVPVALDGSTLPGGIKIRTGKLRGELSEGMLCSLKELGLTQHNYPYAIEDGILTLQSGTVGEDIKKTLGLDEYAIEFEITPNRPDCLSVIGLARETAATYGRPIRLNAPKASAGKGNISDYLSVTVSASELCGRYMARVVRDVKIEPSPAWLRERLHAAGVRPINNIVDITNYVMLEYGQPMHAFDYACLSGKKIDVRRANSGESMNTLDGKTRALTPSILVIADAQSPVAVAGIMGGQSSEITENARTVVFESANFDGTSVRLTSRALGLRTDSSARFEKGLPPELTRPALERACELVELLGAGTVVEGTIDIYSKPTEKRTITPNYSRINQLLGTLLSPEEMDNLLARVSIFKNSGGTFDIPYWRPDVEGTADLAEEVARLHGYDKIQPTMFQSPAAVVRLTPEQVLRNKIDAVCLGLGYDEMLTYTFISPKYYDKINLPADSLLRKSVTIKNPLGDDTSVMRTTVLPSALEVVAYNLNVRNDSGKLYETGVVYLPMLDSNGEIVKTELPEEKRRLMMVCWGEGCDFYALKGDVEALIDALTGNRAEFEPLADNPSYHPGRTAVLSYNGALLGVLGEISPYVSANYGFSKRVYAADLDLSALASMGAKTPQYKPLSRFPSLLRDIAVTCDEEVTVGALSAVIKKAGAPLLKSVELFDIYRGAPVPAGKKSVAFSMTFGKDDGTVTDAEADTLFAKIIVQLKKQLNAELRT